MVFLVDKYVISIADQWEYNKEVVINKLKKFLLQFITNVDFHHFRIVKIIILYYLTNTILVVEYEGLNWEPIRKNASKIEVISGSWINLVSVNKKIGNENRNNTIAIQLQYVRGSR